MEIGCILVLYNPNLILLDQVINSIKDQVEEIFIADNSTITINEEIFHGDKVLYSKMPTNVGIAKAQNVGINYFIKQRFSHVIFLDQDSVPEKDLVATLMNELIFLKEKSIPVGAIGPRPINRENNKEYREKRNKSISQDLTEVNELISSASLIPLVNFEEIGLLEESLFIDGVDHEWCWRAKKIKGLRFFISEKAHLSHKLGEGDRFFILKNIATPRTFRTYYLYRNYLILCRRDYVPFSWKASNGIKYFLKLFYYPIFLKPQKDYFHNIIRGIKDGIFYQANKK
jgi:rhamnosyltransferase